ncbi:MAG: hypothetical protein WCL71_09595, partial [Deltaproteobacteria bacterium]
MKKIVVFILVLAITLLSTLPAALASFSTTKAKIYLAADDVFTVSNSEAVLYGGSGSNIVTILDGATGITLDQNVESIKFSGASSSYTFKQTGNMINIYDAAGVTLLAKAPVQEAGTVLGFSNGKASALMADSGVMTLG